MHQPLAKVRRSLPNQASATGIQAAPPKTFSEVLVWDDFTSGALTRLQELDDTGYQFKPQVFPLTFARLAAITQYRSIVL